MDNFMLEQIRKTIDITNKRTYRIYTKAELIEVINNKDWELFKKEQEVAD